MAKNKNKVICRHGKRTALRSPLSLDSSELFIDSESGALMLNITILNTSTEENPVRVESAGLVIRCLDASGNLIVSGGREIISKTLKFPDEGIAPGAAVGIKTKIDLSPDIVADFDVYIGCIRTTALVVTDFVRGDFFYEPEDPILLSAGMSEEEIYDVCDKISESAVYYPDELSSLVWRCTCGEITDGGSCPKCGAERSALFAFFANLVKPARKVKSPIDGHKRLNLIIAISSIVFFITALVLALLLVFFLSDGRYGGRPNGPDFGDPSHDVQEETLEEKTSRLEALIAAKDFPAALELAKSESAFAGRISEISQDALEHYIETDDYDKALEFAKTAKDPESAKTSVLEAGYPYYINNKIFDKALEYAELLGDSEKISKVNTEHIAYLIEQKEFLKAIDVAASANLDAKKEEIILVAIEERSTARDYNGALEFALMSSKESVSTDLATEAAYYYLEQNDIDSAMSFAQYVNDESLMTDIASKLSDSQLRENLATFFPYISFERKQSVYANSLSLDKQVAVINTAGKVFYGAGKTYIPASGLKAVSVKTSAHHTVILRSDGSVVAFGDNSFGQCDVSLWKNVVAVEVGQYHTVALLEDGTVRACGNRDFDQCSVSSFENVIMISAGDYHTLALLANGTVKACGMNTSSQCETSEWQNITMISAGALHSVGLTSDGKALAVGNLSLGRCDVTSWDNVVMISAGSSHTVALLGDGSVVSCGGVVGGGSYGSIVLNEKVIYVDAGNTSIAAVTESGKLIFSGNGLPNTDHVKNERVDSKNFFTNN